MSTKKINAGDTLTVGDLTDDHLGAVIEVGPEVGLTTRMRLENVERDAIEATLSTADGGLVYALTTSPVKVITPPPVVQPDEPTELGQCIRIEGSYAMLGVVADPGDSVPIRAMYGGWMDWDDVLSRAGDRQIVVSDPPRWPDETPVVPERIEVGEWPDDDTHLREWVWVDRDGERWKWYLTTDKRAGAWRYCSAGLTYPDPTCGPWTRGERVE